MVWRAAHSQRTGTRFYHFSLCVTCHQSGDNGISQPYKFIPSICLFQFCSHQLSLHPPPSTTMAYFLHPRPHYNDFYPSLPFAMDPYLWIYYGFCNGHTQLRDLAMDTRIRDLAMDTVIEGFRNGHSIQGSHNGHSHCGISQWTLDSGISQWTHSLWDFAMEHFMDFAAHSVLASLMS